MINSCCVEWTVDGRCGFWRIIPEVHEKGKWGEVDTKVDLVYILNVGTVGLVKGWLQALRKRSQGKIDSILASGPKSDCKQPGTPSSNLPSGT